MSRDHKDPVQQQLAGGTACERRSRDKTGIPATGGRRLHSKLLQEFLKRIRNVLPDPCVALD